MSDPTSDDRVAGTPIPDAWTAAAASVAGEAVSSTPFTPASLPAPTGPVPVSAPAPVQPGSAAPAPTPDRTGSEPGLVPATVKPAYTDASGRVAAARANAAGQTSQAEIAVQLQQREANRAAQMRAASEHLWPIVFQLLGVVQQTPEIQNLANRFVLTRSHQLDAAQRGALERALVPRLSDVPQLATTRAADATQALNMAYDELIGISVLGPWWRDDDVTEILVDGWNVISIERDGVLIRTGATFRDDAHAKQVARNLAAKVSDRALNPTTPLVTAELEGARVAFAIGKVVKSGLAVAIRKFRPLMRMDGLLAVGALNVEMARFLWAAVTARANIVVSGATSAGKTTLINALSAAIPDTERVITIEDSLELDLSSVKHWLPLQTKEAASADDTVSVTLADLLRATLRMRPDRVIVGEIRDPDAAAVMMQAANTGHDGTMTTIHANDADAALNFRMANLLRTGAAMEPDIAAGEVAAAIDVVIQVVRRRGRRFISEISVVDTAYLDGKTIRPAPIFVGSIDVGDDGTPTPVFRRVGSVGGDTDLGRKMLDRGLADGWVDESQ